MLKIVIVVFLMGCTTQDTNLEYRNGNQSVKLILENPFLSLNQPTKLKVKVENIDVEKLTVSGHGLSSLGHFQSSTQLLFKVVVDEKSTVDGNWEMNMSVTENGKIKWQHKFKIPVTK